MNTPDPAQSTVVPVEPWAPITTASGRTHAPGWEQATCHPGHPPTPVCVTCLDLWPCTEVAELADSVERLTAFLEADHAITLTGLRSLAALIRQPLPAGA